jgi:hypothetical protein
LKSKYWTAVRRIDNWLVWPVASAAEKRFEGAAPAGADPGSDRVLAELIDWLCRAQDCSRSADGGVARDYSLVQGWASSYPETTGYIVPTLLDAANLFADSSDLWQRARRMLDWLVAIQLPSGAYQAGRIDASPVVPVTFNTGQVLLGLTAGERTFGGYREPLRRAADWLVQTQDPDGCWRRFPTPYASPGVKAYETHVAWGLVEAARVEPGRGYEEAALANANWALESVRSNGWIDNCCLSDITKPLTHTIGYALRGILEMYRFGRDRKFLEAARRIADGVLSALRDDGYLPGELRQDWSAAVNWVCLTGTAQIAHCWLILYVETGERRYADAAFRANAFVRSTVRISGAPDVRGGVKGSLPYYGAYCTYQYPNWAAKFLADSLMLEMEVRRSMEHQVNVRTVAAMSH